MVPKPLIIVCWFFSVTLPAGPVSSQEIKTGLVPVKRQIYNNIPTQDAPLGGEETSEEVDLSDKFPPPGDQGKQNSCVGWAISYVKTYQEGIWRKWKTFDSKHMFSPSYIYNQSKLSSSCSSGTTYPDAFSAVHSNGALTLDKFPYDEHVCSAIPSPDLVETARDFGIRSFRTVNFTDIQEIKQFLNAGIPVLIAIRVDDAFQKLGPDQIYGGPSGEGHGEHALVVTGYSARNNAFKGINPRGSSWGTSGYGWIAYSAFRDSVFEAYVMQSVLKKPEPPVTIPASPMIDRPQRAQSLPEFELGIPFVNTSAPVLAPNQSLQPGLQITVPGHIRNKKGHSASLVVEFEFLDGRKLMADPREFVFKDTSGHVAAGQNIFSIPSDDLDLSRFPFSIPTYAMNLVPTMYTTNYNLRAQAFLMIDGSWVQRTGYFPVDIKW